MATTVRERPAGREQIPTPSRVRAGDAEPGYAKDLERELKSVIRGEVRFDRGARAMYSTDGSNNRMPPIGVVLPRGGDDIIETVALCRKYGAPVLARGGGTSLAGQCCNTAVVMDCSKYMREVLEIDAKNRRARVQPGCVLDDLRGKANRQGLTYGPDPATHTHCTLGGMIGNNSCGIHSVMAGRTDQNVLELDVLTYDGLRMRVGPTSDAEFERIAAGGGRRAQIYQGMRDLRDRYADRIRRRFPDIPRRVSGYNLPALLPENGFDVAKALVGSEGTLVTILEATVRLIHNPAYRTLVVLGYGSIFECGDHVPEIMQYKPVGLEGLDKLLIDHLFKKGLHVRDVNLLPKAGGWLLVEFGGDTQQEADANADKLVRRMKREPNGPSVTVYSDKYSQDHVWEIRESGLGATAYVPGEPPAWPGWEDSAVPPDKIGAYLRDLQKLYDKYGYKAVLYGHLGQGCIHTRINFDLTTAKGLETYRAFVTEAANVVVSYGGSLSGEHGDGQSRAELLPIMFGDLVSAFSEMKQIWDPEWKMNPGKVVQAYGIMDNLKLGLDYHPPNPETHFSFVAEDGWSGAANRCVGVGKCRREHGGTMCPSYMATLEEEHSTRGRARTLFEMLQGEVITDGWQSEEVKRALELCLSCKGCKGDCPVNVDMATYKAEFLSHYYEHKPRPRYAYSMGLIMYWARIASLAPHLVNFLTSMPGLNNLVKAVGGISQRRRLPKFAPQTFKDWFARRGVRNFGAPEVILWPDTFNNHFTPRVAQAAVEVLEDAGYRVIVPKQHLCCGRPLFDYGMLDLAEYNLKQILNVLRPKIRAGVPVVGLEPSCTAVFRDELHNLFPKDEDRNRLTQQTFTLGEFLDKKAAGYKPPNMYRKAIVHAHCQHDAIMGMESEDNIMKAIGLDTHLLDSGCCGMAGSFGYEPHKYDVSLKCAERVLYPAVRGAPKDTLLIADGFSCRTQIEDGTNRHALHLAQVLQMAKRAGIHGPDGLFPERGYLEMEVTNGRSANATLAIAAGAALAGAAAWYAHSRKGRPA